MIDKNGFGSQAEREIRVTRTVGPATRRRWENLPAGTKTAYDRSMAFLGCTANVTFGTQSGATAEADRIAAARLMLLNLGLDTSDPGWSSDVLDRFVKSVTETPGGGVNDLFRALFGVLGDYGAELTKPVAAVLKELVIKCFVEHRMSYDAADWKRLAEDLGGRGTKAQLYLALHAIPPEFVSAALAEAMADGLGATEYHGEAAAALAA